MYIWRILQRRVYENQEILLLVVAYFYMSRIVMDEIEHSKLHTFCIIWSWNMFKENCIKIYLR